MRYNNIGGFKSINAYINNKLKLFSELNRNFESLYHMMFSEEENVLYESSNGYKIQKITYGQARISAEGRAKTLSSLLIGVEKDSVVGIYLDNGVEWIEVFWAVLMCGFKPLLINMRLDDESISKALSDCNAVAVISNGKTFSVKTVALSELVPADADFVSGGFGTEFLVMSSGTTKSIKICAYTAEKLYAVIWDSAGIIKDSRLIKKHYEGQLKLLAFLPFYHIFGFVAVYIWFAFFSRTFVALKDLSADTLLDTIRRHKVTHIFAVPLFWQSIYSEAIKTIKARGEKTYKKFNKGLKLSNELGNSLLGRAFSHIAFKEVRENLFGDSISFLISGGSVIDKKVLEFFNGIGYRLANGYGMTEIGITSVELCNKRKIINGASVGKPLTSVQYKIENGELFVKGKGVSSYIIENGVSTPMGEWFKTNDLAVERGGHYYVLGRKDDLIVSVTGENLNPNIIEDKFDFAGIKDVCLIKGGDLPVLLVSVNRYLSREKISEIEALLRNRLVELNLSTQISAIKLTFSPFIKGDEIKKNRARITTEYLENKIEFIDLNKQEQTVQRSELEYKIREFFATALGKEEGEVGFETDFFLDEGGNSLDYMAMMACIKKEFGVDFPEIGSGELNSVSAISAYIKERL